MFYRTPLLLAASVSISCASTPKYIVDDCPVFSEIGPVRVNPAWALDRHLLLEASFKVCPPEEGLAEIRRKRIEIKHMLMSFLSSKTEAELVRVLEGRLGPGQARAIAARVMSQTA